MVENITLPLAVYRYRLTLVDGLAYERLPGEWSGKAKAAFIVPLVVIGVFSGLISDWPALWWWSAVGALVLVWRLPVSRSAIFACTAGREPWLRVKARRNWRSGAIALPFAPSPASGSCLTN
jgi:hypothetical protein